MQNPKKEYTPKEIEKKWSQIWQDKEIYKTGTDFSKKKIHVLDMFPYPSGEGLHAGHCKIFTASDIYSRYKRMQGYNVLHATGWDAFGLPAEQYALKNKVNPKISTNKNTETFKRQMQMMGFSYDWDREINTTDPEFYKWTQWIFLKLWEAGLVKEVYEPINWCPSCKTGLANEDLEGNACERCGTIVEKKPLRQYSIEITKYAEKLLSGLDGLDWKESIKDLQRNWIGKSEGAEIVFKLKGDNFDKEFEIFTTRPDTLFGCTYCVLAPEHDLVKGLLEKNVISNKSEVEKYIEEVKLKTEIERSAEGKEKTGVELKGIKAINPANGEEVPVFIADYVLVTYGSGAIMAVPAHDERDFEFAKKYNIEIKDVVASKFGTELPDAKKVYGSTVIAYDPEQKKFLKMINKNTGETWLPSGGLNDGETYEDCGKRELSEEAGISKFKDFVKLGSPIISYYFNSNKNSNRESIGCNYLAIVDSSQEISFGHEDHESFEIGWTGYDDLYNSIKATVGGVDHWLEALSRAKDYIENKRDIVNSDYGVVINSGSFDGMQSEEAKKAITEFVGGKMVTKYKLRDWVFARQRYWGEPFPLVHVMEKNEKGEEVKKIYPVDESDLPVVLPEVENYEPTGTGESPLANITEWVDVKGFITEKGTFKHLNLSKFNIDEKIIDETFSINLGPGKDSFRFGEKIEYRNIVACIIKHPTEDRYLINTLMADGVEWHGFLTGGIEEGETILEAAKKEILEESGYFKIKKIEDLKFNSSGLFYHVQKSVNRACKINIVYTELESLETVEVSEEEKKLHNFSWVEKSEVENKLTRYGIKILWEKFVYGEPKSINPTKIISAKRETNTMPQWAGSSWYWLRYMDPKNTQRFVGVEEEKYWGQVDMYLGGLEHATRHLIYGRFWHQFLYDIGAISTPEPFKRLEAVGLLMGEGGVKMSKRLGNVVNPDEVVETWGADTVRTYLSFMGAYHDTAVWSSQNIIGVRRFLERVWALQYKLGASELSTELETLIHQTIKKVGEDNEQLKFNTTVSALMILLNKFEEQDSVGVESYKIFLKLLSPLAPFMTEEIWQILGENCSIFLSQWPVYDENKIKNQTINIAVQINGKLRDLLEKVQADLTDEEVRKLAENTEGYKRWAGEASLKKVIVVKNKLINIIV